MLQTPEKKTITNDYEINNECLFSQKQKNEIKPTSAAREYL